MAAIAAFAASDQGRMYAAICDRWGVDPTAGWDDDVLALNFRAALMAAAVEADEPTEPQVIGRQVIGLNPLEGLPDGV